MIPEGRMAGEETTLREWVVDLGHSAHQGVDATKRLLHLRLWFPGMDHEVERIMGDVCHARHLYRTTTGTLSSPAQLPPNHGTSSTVTTGGPPGTRSTSWWWWTP